MSCITMQDVILSMSKLACATAGEHLENIYNNGGYIDFNYGGEFSAIVEDPYIASVLENYTAYPESQAYTVVVVEEEI